MKNQFSRLLAAAAISGLAACATHAVTPESELVSVQQSSLGPVLATAAGMSLYTFAKDAQNLSNCYGGCAQKWPPFLAEAGAVSAGPLTLLSRKDSTRQWAFKGMPLYLWVGDTKAGDVSGDGIKGAWSVVTAD